MQTKNVKKTISTTMTTKEVSVSDIKTNCVIYKTSQHLEKLDSTT